MLSKILIANRGEIAVRVMRTCRELGIATVAVYSELDRDALHVRYADEAYALGGQTAAESYLNTTAILDVLQRSGADGVHPGYGFMSENADFAEAVTKIGVTWIGPPPNAIRVMGDKISSRVAAAKAGVEAVPGTTVPITDVQEILDFGAKFGFPIAIKAAHGGGGRGMKIVESAEHAAEAFEAASREALAYFGRPEAYMERYLTHPRHIEVQVFADQHGNVVALGDRDCSMQRRHQKLVEESPAPGLTDKVRKAMGAAAVKVAKACGYVGAGTVECLYQDGEFWFLEMNTRLQVEHCVTEMVTSLDLVAEQIRVAAGETLSVTQASAKTNGHAIEARINAENAATGFMPSPGTLTRLCVPSGLGVRWDGGYESGDTISQYYDNLIGKLIVWAPTREAAIARMLRALRELEVDGVHTTAPAHEVLLAHPDFAAVAHTTKWVEATFDPASITARTAAGAAPPAENAAAAEAPTVAQTVPVEVNGRRFSVKVWLPEGTAGGGSSGANKARARVKAPVSSAASGMSDGTVTAPMQGTIVKVSVSVGDAVEAGQSVCVLEAMKMENHINAPMAGTIAEIRIETGDSVGGGDVLMTIE